MQAYLAEKYMSGPKADAILSRTAPKKKKRPKPDDVKPSPSGSSGAGGAKIVDDDAGWGDAANAMDVEEDDAAEAVVASDRAFKKRRAEPPGFSEGDGGGGGGGSGWTTLREPTPPPAPDEQPIVVTAEDAPAGPFRGGLLTKKQLRAHLPSSSSSSAQGPHKRDGKERVKEGEDDEEDPEAAAAAQETVYRDSSGRKIDMKMEKAEAARKKREREEREAKKMEWGKGLVQRDDAEKRKQEEERIRQSGFTRYADDEELNRTQKDQGRWNDPAAAFMTKKRTKGPRKPEYTGPPPPPNRFGIKPGYRWDGVDRGNGFEKKYFQKANDRRRTGAQHHDWSVEDM